MTTQTLPAAVEHRGPSFLSRTVRATGYGRVGLGALAAGTYADVPGARLVLPLDRVVAADLRLREGGSRLNVKVAHPQDRLVLVATAAAEAIAADCGLLAAEIDLTLRTPATAASGSDVEQAAALAVVDALARATETQLRARARSQTAATACGRPSAGLTATGPAVIAADGALLTDDTDLPRLLLVLAQPAADLANAADVLAAVKLGQLSASPAPGCAPRELAAWLTDCAGRYEHPVAETMRNAGLDLAGLLGVIGGATATSAVAALFDPAAIGDAQRLLHRVAGQMPGGWCLGMSRTAAP